MPDELHVVAAAVLALGAVAALTPVAIRVAHRMAFYDHPVGYKRHNGPTPYLGGAAVLAGFALAAAVLADGLGRYAVLLACAAGLAVVGAIDDRRTVRPLHRVLCEVAAAGAITAAGLGWTFLDSTFEELLLNTVWIVGFTNAFNLMDNMDGAAATVGTVAAAGIATMAAVAGADGLATLTGALAGACLGFLIYNLRRGAPARIFLGDGGAMPLGFLLAVGAASIPVDPKLGWPAVLGAALLLGVLVLDTLLVVVSRTRRGVALVTGGQDHLTFRLAAWVRTPVRVAATIAVLQIAVSAAAITALQVGRTSVIVTATVCLTLGLAIIAVLDSDRVTAGRGRRRLQVAGPEVRQVAVDAAQAGSDAA